MSRFGCTPYKAWKKHTNCRSCSHTRSTSHTCNLVRLYHTNVWQVTKLLFVVEAIADNKFVGNFETDILEVEIYDPAGSPVEQRANLQGSRIAAQQRSHQIANCKSGVDNILDEQHILAGNIF